MTFARRTVYVLSSMLFLIFLVMPTADRFFHIVPERTVAESDMVQLPKLTSDPVSWGPWFDAVRQGYLDRHYNLRSLLISWHSLMEAFVLPSMSPSAKIIVGTDHWLFLAQDRDIRNILEEALSPEPVPDGPMAVLTEEFERRRQWLAARGIRYLVIVAPNKNTVYPENLPEALRPTKVDTHLAQFVQYVRSHSKVAIVDVTPALLEQKKQESVFYAIDSHWNSNGAFTGYLEIMKSLKKFFPDMPTLDRNQFRLEFYGEETGDLAFMMGLVNILKESRYMYVNKEWYAARGQSYAGPMDPHYFDIPQYSYTGNDTLPNAVVFHDSYWWEILPFIAEPFNKALHIWLQSSTETSFRYFDTALIEREKPDIVIDEFAERYIVPPLHGHFNIKSETSMVKP
jgi:hypothetical protein